MPRDVDRQAERDEDDDLRERREPLAQASTSAWRGASTSPRIRPGDEDGEEARAVRERRDAEDGRGEREREIPRGRAPSRGSRRASSEPPAMPTRRPIAICSAKTRTTTQKRLVGVRRELDQPEHQRDPDRVVRARLAFEDRVGAALDLAVAEHREHDRGVGRGDRGAEQPAVIQPIPSAQWAKTATSPAVANVPGRPSSDDRAPRPRGSAAVRSTTPPSKRITTSAALATSSTVWMESAAAETRSEANAAATSSTAARGNGRTGSVHAAAQDKKVLTFRSFRA